MPTLSSMKIPPPKDWEEFEEVTLSSLKIKWSSPNLYKHGRKGQPQSGIDIYGEDDLGRLVGVQCKNTDTIIPKSLIEEEIRKAETFKPAISTFFVATTLPTDVNTQKNVRLMSKDRVDLKKFPVGIFFWEDLVQELVKNKAEFSKHYPEISLQFLDRSFGPLLLSIFDISYFGIQVKSYIELIFGEIGQMSNEDPIQIRTIGTIIKSSAPVVFSSEKANEVVHVVDQMVQMSLMEISSKFESDKRWREVDRLASIIKQDISAIEYSFQGRQLAVYTLGRYLGRWNEFAINDTKVTKKSEDDILVTLKAIGVDGSIIKYVKQQIKTYNSDSSDLGTVHIPSNIYAEVRRFLQSRAILET